MKNVVLLSTRRLPPAYFDTVRADLGGDPELGLDVVAWVPPAGPVADKVSTFTLIGPGRMPVAAPPAAEEAAASTNAPTDEAPDAVIAPEAVAEPGSVTTDGEVTPAAAEAPDTPESPDAAVADQPAGAGDGSAGSTRGAAEGDRSATPAVADQLAGVAGSAVGEQVRTAGAVAGDQSARAGGGGARAGAGGKPGPSGGQRVKKAVAWRYRKLRKVGAKVLPASVKKSRVVRFVRGNRQNNDLGKTYWSRIQARRDVLATIEKADVVVALDAGAIWAGWNLGQQQAEKPVVLGIPAARRELDRIAAGRG